MDPSTTTTPQLLLHEEYQYLNLINHILVNGLEENTRNGVTKTIFGNSMRFSLKDGTLPIITTKKLAWKTCFKELMFFIRGQTDNTILKNNNVHIWDMNSTREFLDSRGLFDNEENDLGPLYGFQWRHWNASYFNCHENYSGRGIDQLQNIINSLKNPNTRSSRRLLMTAWNPEQIDEMALPPCHVMVQFHVEQNKYLSACLFQRSCDVGLGVPFNIMSYSLLIHILAKHCDLIANEFVYFMGNTHIYQDHIIPLQEQIKRTPMIFPKIQITNAHSTIEEYNLEDVTFIEEYNSHEPIKMCML
jgi:thymidylate synthase